MTTQHPAAAPADRPLVRVRRPAELIAAVPYLLNFTPQESIVLVTTRDRGGRSLVDAAVRVDLHTPPGWYPERRIVDPENTAAQLADRLTGHGPVDTLLFIYSDDALPTGWVDRFTSQAQQDGLQLAGGWQVRTCEHRGLWPEITGWESDEDGDGSRIAAEFVLQGRAPAASRADLLPDLRPATDEIRDLVERVAVKAGDADVHLRRRAVAAWLEALETGEPLGPARCGLLHAGLTSVLVRDALLGSCLGLPAAQVRRAASSKQAAEHLLDGLLDQPAPDRDRLAVTTALLIELIRCAPPGRRGEPLAVLAWCSWWAGDGASANQYLELLLCADPGHRLGRLLESGLDRGMRPGWVR